jgi:anti-sigma regulatory factor (Ser/Thr protein kinase)
MPEAVRVETKLSGETVRLTIPAALEYVRIVRLTASGVASRLGFDIEEIEDLRVAVDELTSLVVEAADGGELDVVFSVHDSALHIDGEARITPGRSPQPAKVEGLTAQILAAVVDEWQFEAQDDRIRFCCVRRVPNG